MVLPLVMLLKRSAMLIAVAGEASDPDAMVKEFAKRNAGPGHLRVNGSLPGKGIS